MLYYTTLIHYKHNFIRIYNDILKYYQMLYYAEINQFNSTSGYICVV